MSTLTLMLIIFVLNVIDYAETMYAVSLFSSSIEANPLGRIMIDNGSVWILKFVVLPAGLIILGILIKLDHRQKWALYVILAAYIFAVIYNFITLSEMGAFDSLIAMAAI